MIDISPKALRFARLAAEQQPSFSGDPQVAVIKRDEDTFRRKNSLDRVGQRIRISDRTADFCLRVVSALLGRPDLFETFEWDGNDVAFMQEMTTSLREQLDQPNVQSI